MITAVIVAAVGCRRTQPPNAMASTQRNQEPAPAAASLAALKVSSRDGSADAGTSASPIEQAMAHLLTAMASNDPAGVLACFSKRRPTYVISSGPDGRTRTMKLPYSQIAKGMKTDGDIWYYFFDDDSELARGVQRGQPWSLVKGRTFVPPEYASNPDGAPAAIRWRKEGDVLVIDAIIDSGA